ncbi:hypothetical protein [Isoptericola sp. NPDC058082]|uniref:hypothetical protein n=1 Tax=Isoptericola sp. NPDC058082 TaxID=3346331 RepID=UPI0036E1BD05
MTTTSIGIVSSPTPAWTDALGIGCLRHRAARGEPCWTLPGDVVRRSHAAVCAERVRVAQAVHANQARTAAHRLHPNRKRP